MVIVIGRGHSGTRVISKLLYDNGFKTGEVNASYDMVPPEEMYCAAKLFGQRVRLIEDYNWNFQVGGPTPCFKTLVKMYLHGLQDQDGFENYFKLPETTLCYPWITELFPEARYIHWVRDPRDFSAHMTDRFRRWRLNIPRNRLIQPHVDKGIPAPRVNAAVSCKYQWDIVNQAPRPTNFLRMKYEEFCTDQHSALRRLSTFLCCELKPVQVSTASVQKWKKERKHYDFPFLGEMIKALDY